MTTTNLLEGYLRRNGPPYSADATLQEFYDYHVQPNGDEWFTVTTVVTDPTVSQWPIHHELGFQETTQWRRLGSDAVLGEVGA